MTTVNVCDRCGAFGKDEVFSKLTLRDQYGDIDTGSEICATCRVELAQWVLNSPNRNGEVIKERYSAPPKIDPQTREMARLVAEEYVRAQQAMRMLPTGNQGGNVEFGQPMIGFPEQTHE